MNWLGPLLLTTQLMVVSVVIAAVIGIPGAWAGSSLQMGGRIGRGISNVFFAAVVAAAVTPMILHAAAWEATAGKFGWWMLTQTGTRTSGAGVYGFFSGLVASAWIHGLVGGSIVTIATWFSVNRVTPSVLAQSQTDFGPMATFWRVRLPIAAPWCIASLVATAALAATEMTVVDLYGYRTTADQFYLFHSMDATPLSILATCFVPLAIGLATVVWLVVSRRRVHSIRSRSHEEHVAMDDIDSRQTWIAIIIAFVIGSILILVPATGLVVKVGQDVIVENDEVILSWSFPSFVSRMANAPHLFASEFKWTAILATMTATVSVMMAWPIAALARTHQKFEVIADMTSIVLVCLPGPIVGLGIVSFFQMNLPGFTVLYQQTLVPTTLALLFRSGPLAYWICRSGYRGVDVTIFESASLDLGWWRRMIAIDRPLLIRALTAAWLATAVVSSGDVPATLPVIPAGVTTVGVRLFGLLHSGARYQEASLAIIYILAMVAIVLICFRPLRDRRAKMRSSSIVA